jgi:hypothetical protein
MRATGYARQHINRQIQLAKAGDKYSAEYVQACNDAGGFLNSSTSGIIHSLAGCGGRANNSLIPLTQGEVDERVARGSKRCLKCR